MAMSEPILALVVAVAAPQRAVRRGGATRRALGALVDAALAAGDRRSPGIRRRRRRARC